MGTSCCIRSRTDMDLNIEKENLICEIQDLNKVINPYYYWSLPMIELAEQKFVESGKNIQDYINVEFSYILHAQFKSCYSLVKKDLEQLFENKNVADLVFYDLVMLVLSASNNTYDKKELLCLTVVEKYVTTDIKDYSLFIESIKTLISICLKISIVFVYFPILLNIEDVETELESFFIGKRSVQFRRTATDYTTGDETLGFSRDMSEELKRPRTLKSPIIEIHLENLHVDFVETFNSLYSYVKTHMTFEKFLDKIVNFALDKLLFRKNIFNEVSKEEVKSIIEDVVEVLSCSNLIAYIFK